MNPKSDNELVLEVQEGGVAAFEELVKRYQKRLYPFVYHIVWDHAMSSDVVQDALVRFYQMIERVDPKRKVSTLIYEIAKNAAISELRKHARLVSLESIELAVEDEDFYDQLGAKDTAIAIRKAVEKLPPKFQSVIRLYYFDDLSYEDIARKLGLPVNTVRTHLKRAKDQLKRVLSYEA